MKRLFYFLSLISIFSSIQLLSSTLPESYSYSYRPKKTHCGCIAPYVCCPIYFPIAVAKAVTKKHCPNTLKLCAKKIKSLAHVCPKPAAAVAPLQEKMD